jgi:hypothetical protein
MKINHKMAGISTLCLSATLGYAQGTFQNLDFESANVPVLPSGQQGFTTPAAGLPGWTVYYGTNQFTGQIFHNDVSEGAVSVSILGPHYNAQFSPPIIDGSFSAVVQAGGSATQIAASIAQTGMIPVGSRSIQLDVSPFSSQDLVTVSVGGQNIPLVPLSTRSSYTVFEGDISAFAGQTEQLMISAPPIAADLFNSDVIDDIVFSSQSAPEPGSLALLSCAGLLFGCSRWRRKR